MSETYTNGYALVMGAGGNLPQTINDAKDVANFLRDSQRCAYPTEQVKLLVSHDANRKNIISALKSLSIQIANQPSASLYIYFSGHGIFHEQFYILPNGYDLSNLDATCISGLELQETMKMFLNKKLIFVLDCCHAGGMPELTKFPIEKSPPPINLMNAMIEGEGRIIISSSRKNETSLILKDDANSIFTKTLLEAMAGVGVAEKDGYVRVSDLLTYLSRAVPNRTNGRQNPVFKFQGLDNFVVSFYSGGDTQVKTPKWIDIPTKPAELQPSKEACASWKRQLQKRKENLLLIEERMSEYVLYTDIPLLLVKEKMRTEDAINELENLLLSC